VSHPLGLFGASAAIDSKWELDVWVVYTSIVAGGGIGETRGPVRVPATKVKR